MKKILILAGIIFTVTVTSCCTRKNAQPSRSATNNEVALTHLAQESGKAFKSDINNVLNNNLIDSIRANANSAPYNDSLAPDLQAIRNQMSSSERVFADKAIDALKAGTLNTEMPKILTEIAASTLPQSSKEAMSFFVSILQSASTTFGPSK